MQQPGIGLLKIALMTPEKQHGFTLYELLITIVVIGVILALGVPNLGDFTRNSRVTAAANDFHGSFLLARSEAARAKANVTICASDEPFGTAGCDGASFEDGWIIFVDINGDGARAGTDENVLRAHGPVDDRLNIVTDGGIHFSYAPNGLGRPIPGTASLLRAMICDERGNEDAAGGRSAARLVVVTPVGRSTVVRDVGQITASAGGVACP